jgi:hypothetical protein
MEKLASLDAHIFHAEHSLMNSKDLISTTMTSQSHGPVSCGLHRRETDCSTWKCEHCPAVEVHTACLTAFDPDSQFHVFSAYTA